jgi:MFS family permease
VFVFGVLGAPILGGIVASRRPENPYGWLWLGFGLSLALVQLSETYAAYSLIVEPGSLPAPRAASGLLEGLGFVVAITLLPFLLLLFPTGRLPSQRWRPVAWIVLAAGATGVTLGPFLSEDSVLIIAVVMTLIIASGLSALSLVVRYRGASGVERQQLKWFAFAAVLLVAVPISDLLGLHRLLGNGLLWTLLDNVTLTGLYVAVGIAILRYRLYEIDLIINRTLVYGSLTAMLVAVYVGGVATTQAVFRALTGQEQQPQLAVVISTLVIAALFNPLRRRIQAFIDSRFYRRKYDAAKTLKSYSAKLRDETDLDALNAELVGVVRETMQPAHVSLWLRPPAEAGKGVE